MHVLIAAADYWGTQRACYTAEKLGCFFEKMGASVTKLIGAELNVAVFMEKYKDILGHLEHAGERVIVVTIGHGNQFRDYNGDEPDGLDEGFQLPNGVILDDQMTECANAAVCHASSLFVLISDHCSSGTMLDNAIAGKNWVNISSSLPYEDSLADGDGNVMITCLLEYLSHVDLKKLKVNELQCGLIETMKNSFVGELQHPLVVVSHDGIYDMTVFV